MTRLVALAKAEKPAKPVAKVVGTMADYAKAIVALVSQGKLELPWAPDPPDLNALIREKAPKVSPVPPTQANGVPNPPDLNAAIVRARQEVK
ncbi:MAG: hypothetical protein WC815_00840 [Vicinamibacterales bacterium]